MLHARRHDGDPVRPFTLHLLAATRYERVEGVTSFVGEDASGSFGLLAGHARFMASLRFGLARFRVGDGAWQYLALPRALIYFLDNELFLGTRRYVLDTDYERISHTLQQELMREEHELRDIRRSLREMEEQLLKRLWQTGHDLGRTS
jgi:F-type H+-transporting ATPase subunit epsilon